MRNDLLAHWIKINNITQYIKNIVSCLALDHRTLNA